MATSFITSLPAACFSSALPDVRVTTDADFVVLTVRDAGNVLVVQLKSYPYGGVATFADLRSVVGQWLLKLELFARVFHFAVRENMAEQAEVECEADVLVAYCGYGLQGADFDAVVGQKFLTTLASKVIYPNVEETLSVLALPDTMMVMTVEGSVKKNGVVDTFTYVQKNPDAGGSYTPMSYTLSLETLAESAGGTPLFFTCKVSGRSFSFYAAKEQPPCVFRFRNAFNAIETAAFFGTTTARQEVEREEAVSGGTTSFYDENAVQSFEVETSALAPDFAAWLAQLFASPDVRLWQKGTSWDNLPRILITESTYEISDSDTEQHRVKFTWRYADNTPQLAAALLPHDGIFTEPYNAQFT